jgi:hypothetical protein
MGYMGEARAWCRGGGCCAAALHTGPTPAFLSTGAQLLRQLGGRAPALASDEGKPVSIHVCVDGC